VYEKQIDELVERIRDDFNPKAIIIFGSVARGTADELSDLDVAVIMDTDLAWTQRTVTVRRSLRNIRIPLDVLVFTPEEIEFERRNPCTLVSEMLKSGTIVYGTI